MDLADASTHDDCMCMNGMISLKDDWNGMSQMVSQFPTGSHGSTTRDRLSQVQQSATNPPRPSFRPEQPLGVEADESSEQSEKST